MKDSTVSTPCRDGGERGGTVRHQSAGPGYLRLRSQQRTASAQQAGRFEAEIVPVVFPSAKQPPVLFSVDEHPGGHQSGGPGAPRDALPGKWHGDGGQCLRGQRRRLCPAGRVRGGGKATWTDAAGAVVAMAASGLAPRIMGYGPVEATARCLTRRTCAWPRWMSSN